MNQTISGIPEPKICSKVIFAASGSKLDPDVAARLWPRIMDHKWLMSEQLRRDVGFRTACIDFFENMEPALKEFREFKQRDLLTEMGAQPVSPDIWDTISDSQPPKQLISRRIILPLKEASLSKKHGVLSPNTIIFFGPPGTGKTHFVKAIAGVLSWWYVEILPSALTAGGSDKIGTTLQTALEKARNLENVVVFIDEFEELATSRTSADRIDKTITNIFLKQVPLFKKEGNRVLLVCATNYISRLDPALLRPGRFDCIIPVGIPDEQSRKTILQHYLSKLNAGDIDIDLIVKMTSRFTPADIEYLFRTVAQFSFEQEYATGRDYRVTTDTLVQIVPKIRASLTDEIVDEFKKDSITYSRI